jgi:GNAT superfamily N-acetyltransferase
MEVVDLREELLPPYYCCLEDWSPDMKDAGDHKDRWYRFMRERGLRVKLAVENGTACGMIQYLPVEESTIEGKGVFFIACIWVHGHKQGIGNRQRRGMGKALLGAAEDDARARGAEGMAAWGLILPFWMKASWFRKHGYRNADRDGIAQLLWKPFVAEATPPRWIRKRRNPESSRHRVTVTAFVNGWCPVQNLLFERAKRAAAEFGESVEFRAIETLDRRVLAEWGIADGLFIDNRQVRTGPPLPYEKTRRMIEKRVRRRRS